MLPQPDKLFVVTPHEVAAGEKKGQKDRGDVPGDSSPPSAQRKNLLLGVRNRCASADRDSAGLGHSHVLSPRECGRRLA